MAVLDFGQSFIKRGIALYRQGGPPAISFLPSLPAPEIARGDVLFEAFVDAVAQTWISCEGDLAPKVVACMASYMDESGQPVADGYWGNLRALSSDIPSMLSKTLAVRLGQDRLDIELLHDGTAAALSYTGSKQTAVIMVGTALGIGFPRPSNPRFGTRNMRRTTRPASRYKP